MSDTERTRLRMTAELEGRWAELVEWYASLDEEDADFVSDVVDLSPNDMRLLPDDAMLLLRGLADVAMCQIIKTYLENRSEEEA